MSQSNSDPLHRFSDRVADYVRYRPRYPQQIIDLFRDRLGLTSESVVADIGSGTGFLAEMFLRNGNPVFGIEPNREMRLAGEEVLAGYDRFVSLDATAEQTGLPAASVDFVIAAQAFHWFDPARTRQEFQRILRPGGFAVLVWNSRHVATSPFLVAYEQLLHTFGTDYANVVHRSITASDDSVLREFFAPAGFTRHVIHNYAQTFDFEALLGRLMSSSYVPSRTDPAFEPMRSALREIFDTYQSGGSVQFVYDTEVYYGTLAPASETSHA